MAVTTRMRFEVLRRDGYRCRYCGAGADRVSLTVDHVMPKALGGTDVMANLVTACETCNSGKTSTVPDAAVLEVTAVAVEPSALRKTAWSLLGEWGTSLVLEPIAEESRPAVSMNLLGAWFYAWEEDAGAEPGRGEAALFTASVTPALSAYTYPVLWGAAKHAAFGRATAIGPYAHAVHTAVQAELRAQPA